MRASSTVAGGGSLQAAPHLRRVEASLLYSGRVEAGKAMAVQTGSLACCTRPAPKKGATSASPAVIPEL